MRRGFGLIGLLGTAILLAIVGVIAYNVGWSDGVATHLPAATDGARAVYYGEGPGWGAGFGFLWFLFILFGFFFLLRLVFFGGRMWGRGWGGGYGRGGGFGHHGMPPGIDERMQDWHKRAHGDQPSGTTPPPPPPPSTQSV